MTSSCPQEKAKFIGRYTFLALLTTGGHRLAIHGVHEGKEETIRAASGPKSRQRGDGTGEDLEMLSSGLHLIHREHRIESPGDLIILDFIMRYTVSGITTVKFK